MQFGISISPLRTGFGPVLYDADMGGLCEGLAAAGYDGVEVSLVTPEAFTPTLAKAIAAAKRKVYSIATGQSYIRDKLCLYSFAAPDAARSRRPVKPDAQAMLGGGAGRIVAIVNT
jgi:hypothetical protein